MRQHRCLLWPIWRPSGPQHRPSRSRRGGGWNWVGVVLRVVQLKSIPALARWNGDHAMTKDTTKEAAVAAEALLLDDWFDAIEDGIWARARGFIETMLEEELSEALSRPRYGRRKPGEDEAAAVGCRRAPRASRADADGHCLARRGIAVPRALLVDRRGRQDARMAERFAARLPAPHPGRRRLDRRGLSRQGPTPAACDAR